MNRSIDTERLNIKGASKYQRRLVAPSAEGQTNVTNVRSPSTLSFY